MTYLKLIELMQQYDPDGEYTVEACRQHGWSYLDVLQAWYYGLKQANVTIPAWLVLGINWLDRQLV